MMVLGICSTYLTTDVAYAYSLDVESIFGEPSRHSDIWVDGSSVSNSCLGSDPSKLVLLNLDAGTNAELPLQLASEFPVSYS